jgi:hypothetical protein
MNRTDRVLHNPDRSCATYMSYAAPLTGWFPSCRIPDERRKTVASYRRIEVKPIAGALGAEIASVDLGILDDETFKEIEAAWLEHLVVFFRSQCLSP